jgi:hypothetical protein
MAPNDRLIAFLEREADALRRRIESLRDTALPELGPTTGDGDLTPDERSLLETESRLKEVEGHLADLRDAAA